MVQGTGQRWYPLSIPLELAICDRTELVRGFESLGISIPPGNESRIANYLIRHTLFLHTWPKAKRLLAALHHNPAGLTRTQISVKVYSRNVRSEVISEVLNALQIVGALRCHREPGVGRTTERWLLSPPYQRPNE